MPAGYPGQRCLWRTGQTFDWQLAKEVAAQFPVIIAGGLTPENVGQLIEEVQPWGVDVSSGVETEGKRISKIKNLSDVKIQISQR